MRPYLAALAVVTVGPVVLLLATGWYPYQVIPVWLGLLALVFWKAVPKSRDDEEPRL